MKTLAPDERATFQGTVKWFHYATGKNYGYIVRAGEKDLYVHISGIGPGQQKLEPGDSVEFKIDTKGSRGPRAEEVKRIQD